MPCGVSVVTRTIAYVAPEVIDSRRPAEYLIGLRVGMKRALCLED
jgi:hypothetical protein